MRGLLDILVQVFQSIWANKLRSFLTMFGIAWGVASLLLLVGLGEGFRSGQTRSLAELGTDMIMMWSGTVPALPEQHRGMTPYKLTMRDVAAVRTGAPHVRNATGILTREDIKQVRSWVSIWIRRDGALPTWPGCLKALRALSGHRLRHRYVEKQARTRGRLAVVPRTRATGRR